MKLGFLGTGTIAEAVLTGLCTGADPPPTVVSPRNADRARALAGRFATVTVGKDNQAVLDGADLVFVAVRPQQADDVLKQLRFRRDHRVVSFAALYPMSKLSLAVAPATAICRAIPLPSAAMRVGPIAVWPMLPEAVEILARIGTIVPIADESLLEPVWATTALMAPFYEQLRQITSWAVDEGVSPEQAGAYVAALYSAWSAVASGAGDDLAALRDTSQTLGGLNEQALRIMTNASHYAALHTALDAVLGRLRESAV
ncbi:MAG: NAD(P)-binding domain-containing protein [Methylobacteriaceae bacterium]|nr:NAD(P)-binding domain-containing protein [Methylobacteriaceae bacterium]